MTHVLLFFHLLGAVAFFAGGAVVGTLQLAAIRRERPSEVYALLRLAPVGAALVGHRRAADARLRDRARRARGFRLLAGVDPGGARALGREHGGRRLRRPHRPARPPPRSAARGGGRRAEPRAARARRGARPAAREPRERADARRDPRAHGLAAVALTWGRRTGRRCRGRRRTSARSESGPSRARRVLRPADHAEAVDRRQRDPERGEPRVEVPRGREHGLAGDEVGDEEEADLEGVAAEDVAHRERVVAEPRRRRFPSEISGSAVAAASTVAPKITPLTPSRFASSLPLSSRATPAQSVTARRDPEERGDSRGRRRRANGCGWSGCMRSRRPAARPAAGHLDLPARILRARG